MYGCAKASTKHAKCKQAGQEHQPVLHLLAGTRLLRDLGEEPDVREVDALEAPKLEEVDEHRDRKGGQGPTGTPGGGRTSGA